MNKAKSSDSQFTPSEINVPSTPKNICWGDGRRLVELKVLAEALGSCDNKEDNCTARLDLRNCVQETRVGFASLLWVTCGECGELNKVATGKSHVPEGKKKEVFDINTKHASAMIHAGLASTALNRYFAAINVPPVSQTTIKKREREIGPQIEKEAESSCQNGIDLEVHNSGTPDLTASFDMGWQCKGSGKSYNSKSGHAVLIGKNTGKILNFATRIANCKQCEIDKTVPHDCRMNWGGSSKAMEGDAAVELLKKTKTPEYRVTTIVNDEDSTTMAKISKEIEHEVEKNSDINHCKKTVGNTLYQLKSKHKVLSTCVIRYIQKCFSYAISQNKNDVEATKAALLNIVLHLYNEHDSCGEWCKHKNEPGTKYKHLPYGQPLSDQDLRIQLEGIFEKQAKNADKLCPNASSNSNESFNMTVAAKAPKSKHYSKSESLDFRVAAAVCQKNTGEGYLPDVFKNIGLSPGKITRTAADRFDKSAEKRRLRASTKNFKRRRLQLKHSNYASLGQKELREGVTYQSSVAMDIIGETDTLSIPSMKHQPSVGRIPLPTLENIVLLGFDLETTSLSDTCEIIQISAANFDFSETFDQYVLPVGPISASASKVNGITKINDKMFLRSRPIECVDIVSSLGSFGSWLYKLGQEVVLVGHNANTFDSKHLWRVIENNGVGESFPNWAGFIDTLPLFRKLYPNETSHKQESIFALIIGGVYNAHNALGDVKALIEMLNKLNIAAADYSDFSFTRDYVIKRNEYNTQKKANLQTLQPLIQNRIISENMAQKIAASGLTFSHIKLAFQRAGQDGIKDLLSEKFDEKTRVTCNKKIISKVFEFCNNS